MAKLRLRLLLSLLSCAELAWADTLFISRDHVERDVLVLAVNRDSHVVSYIRPRGLQPGNLPALVSATCYADCTFDVGAPSDREAIIASVRQNLPSVTVLPAAGQPFELFAVTFDTAAPKGYGFFTPGRMLRSSSTEITIADRRIRFNEMLEVTPAPGGLSVQLRAGAVVSGAVSTDPSGLLPVLIGFQITSDSPTGFKDVTVRLLEVRSVRFR